MRRAPGEKDYDGPVYSLLRSSGFFSQLEDFSHPFVAAPERVSTFKVQLTWQENAVFEHLRRGLRRDDRLKTEAKRGDAQ
ncbi:hypothetical protein [Citrifermentans bemidjiense]|uniref:hypothetical protein n=1 Tax=Citrifermentans bemidjiense TaxID=225194 RepID=UPI00014F9FEE|nr:hypothetical protein [Citrifermentans bemidjiense]